MLSFFKANKDEKENSIAVTVDDKEVPEEDVGQVALDILDLENMLVIVAPIAGPDGDTIDISVSRNILTISGERKRPDVYLTAMKKLVEECFF
jgi:HSP20 family molecular chaperone IbpA